MIASAGWLTPTRAVGLVAYGVACSSCLLAYARNASAPKTSKLTAMLAAIEGALLLDILFNGRWILHQFFVDFAASQGVYEFRRAPQVIFLVLLVAILVSAATSILRRFRSQISLGIAIVGVLVSLGTWSVEVVSLHQVDAVLYHAVGRIMVVSLVWCAACATTSFGVLLSNPGVVRHD